MPQKQENLEAASPGIFHRLETEVIRDGLCTHCGTCVGLSGGALQMKLTPQGPLPSPVSDKKVPLPKAALEACPGKGIDYPGLCQKVFGKLPTNWLLGCYQRLYVGYSRNPEIRRRAASGGVLTQTLAYLLQKGLIDGAVVVRQGQPQPWQAEPIIARSVEEILSAAQSVYLPVPVNTLLPSMDSFPGRLAYVGLPDQVESLRQLQTLGHPGALKVEYVLGPYVGVNLYQGAIESYLRSNGIHSLEEVAELRYREGDWPGHLFVKTRSGRVLKAEKFYYNYLIPFYITRSSLLSVNFTNELTDISVGDAWHPRYETKKEGYSAVISRSEKGENLLRALEKEKLIHLEEISPEEALAMHAHMIDFKKRGAFLRMGFRKTWGKRIPQYGYAPKRIPFSRQWVELVICTAFFLSNTRVARRIVEFVPLGIIGPLFNTFRKIWKSLSKPTKRKGLCETAFVTSSTGAKRPRAIWRRVLEEIHHWLRPHWSFYEVARHWDETDDYDSINAKTPSYFRRFTDGFKLADISEGSHVLDLCARTGNGTLYFYQQGKVKSAVCADVSSKMGEICRRRLQENGFKNFQWFQLDDYDLPFEDAEFDALLCFETVEHVSEPERLLQELGRVVKPGGTMVLTTPNVLWEPVHALAAIAGLHHSEGPHRFIPVRRLRRMVKTSGFQIEKEETTVLVPGGPAWLVKFGEWVEERTKKTLMPLLGLRRILICRKG